MDRIPLPASAPSPAPDGSLGCRTCACVCVCVWCTADVVGKSAGASGRALRQVCACSLTLPPGCTPAGLRPPPVEPPTLGGGPCQDHNVIPSGGPKKPQRGRLRLGWGEVSQEAKAEGGCLQGA